MAFEVRQGFVLDYLSSDFWLAAGEIQTGAAAYLARKRAQQKAAEKEKEKDLAAAEIQTSSAHGSTSGEPEGTQGGGGGGRRWGRRRRG
jgi:hypothetical protein